jgi:biopolymer transport protein ExbB
VDTSEHGLHLHCHVLQPYDTEADQPIQPRDFTLQAIIADAGWPIWPLLFVSIVALAIIAERILSLRTSRVVPPTLVKDVERMARADSIDLDSIERLAASSACGQVLATILRERNKPVNEIRIAAEETGSDVAFGLQKYLPALATIGTIAPLMGLFGTVVGMIEIFAEFGPTADPGQLARGISVALYNAGFGILIAIPAIVAHRLLRVHVDHLLVRIEQAARQIIAQLDRR